MKDLKIPFITVKNLQDMGNTMQAIEWAREQKGEYPKKPSKPLLKNAHTSVDVAEYQNKLIKYEGEIKECEATKTAWHKRATEIDSVIIAFIKEQAGLDTVPEQYQDKVWSKAWSDGHSDGFYSVYQKLSSLVDIFH